MMDWRVKDVFPFAFDDLWRPSIFTNDAIAEGSIFHAADLELPTLQLQDHDEALLKQDTSFELPALDEPADTWPIYLDHSDSAEASGSDAFSLPPIDDDGEKEDDIWTLDLDATSSDTAPRLLTWEAFEKKATAAGERSTHLSEAGPGVFDALLQERDRTEGVLPQDVMIKALCSLALGRASVFFRWDYEKQCFTQTLDRVPISGLSLECSHGYTAEVLGCGALFRQLSHYATQANTVGECTALTAFKRCVRDELDTIECFVSEQLAAARSLLQIQAIVERPCALLMTLSDLRSRLHSALSDEDVISSVSDRVSLMTETGNPFASGLNTILARVSTPWIERLMEELGLARSSGSPISGNHIPVEQERNALDASSASRPGLENRLPAFVGPEEATLISNTAEGVKLLQRQLPDSPLLHPASYGVDVAMEDGLRTSGDLDIIVSQAKRYEEQVKQAITKHRHEPSAQAVRAHRIHAQDICTDNPSACPDEDMQTQQLAELSDRMTDTPACLQRTSDELRETTEWSLQNLPSIPLSNELLSTTSVLRTTPISRLRPVIEAQSRLVNGTLLRYLFRDCKLREHLTLQRNFHLLGDGNFVARLSTALFSAETQSAQRTRGTYDTGETMGLRLDARENGQQRWPPASSELRLTLMGILNEVYRGRAGERAQLPGGMSFAIRELSDAEIERVMDASSIYALDFLRLQYAAPTPLDAILTPASMQRYDEIFRFLLRVLRVMHVTTTLANKSTRRDNVNARRTTLSNKAQETQRFAFKAHHTITVLMSHFMDLCIRAPWQDMTKALEVIESAMVAEDANGELGTRTSVGIEDLRQLHDKCLESMRARLFLRRKHANVKIAVDKVLETIFELAAMNNYGSQKKTFGPEMAAFDAAVSGLHGVLREVTSKPSKYSDSTRTSEEDAEVMKLLLQRLTWDNSLDTG